MSASDILNRSVAGPRRRRVDRRNSDRRTHSRLRDLCDEVLASYRMAQGQEVLPAEERDSARQLLRKLTPQVVR